ncbi:MAG: peptide ABC transporter substrate-binding protein [Armatimonadetes bacterium]|nr:peptide ABC transporter substrate-binding protein [Anaerolineae bacterium]
MNKTHFTRVVSVALMLALLTAALSLVNAQEAKVLVTSISMVGGDLETIDPGLAETSSQIEIINQIFIGVTNQEETDGTLELGIATDFTQDGLVYTFTLIENLPWVRYNADSGAVEQVNDADGNPRFVTAQDVVDSIKRSLAPETASPYSYVLAPYIVGGLEFNAGEGSVDDVQAVAVDELTLQITAPEAVAFAPSIYGLWVARAVPGWLIEEFGDSWTEPENIATYGPFALKEWAHEESITLIKNPFWTGTDAIPVPMLDEVLFRFLDPQQQFAEYLAGTIDAINVPLEELDRVRADAVLSPEYGSGTSPCTYYLGFDNFEAPMDNVHLRRALSLAIDRESIVTNVTRGGQIAAKWFARPGLDASPLVEWTTERPDVGIGFDPEAAQAELALALEELGLASAADLTTLTLSYGDSSNHGAIMQAIQQMWTDTLGITVTLVALEPSTYFSTVSEDAPIIYRSGWCQDYSDANNFLFDVFYSKSTQNDPGFQNAEFDALVEEARLETDVEVRRELYAQADEILSDTQAGIAPIYWYTTNRMIKPYVEFTVATTGNQAYYNWNVSK